MRLRRQDRGREGPSFLVPAWLAAASPLHSPRQGASRVPPDHRIDHLLRTEELKPLTPYTITDPDRLAAQLSEIRRTGIALDHQEIEVGLCCVAAPIFGTGG